MPRLMTTEARQRLEWERKDAEIRSDIGAWMGYTGKTVGDLANMIGVSRGTMYTRYKRPETLTLAEMRKLYQVIGQAASLRERLAC